MGRYRKENCRNIYCVLRLNEDENDILEDLARLCETSKSEVLRRAMLRYYILVKKDFKNVLRKY